MRFVVYLKNEDGKFEKVETAGNLSAYFGDDTVHEVIIYPCKTHSSRRYRYREIAMFRDLDLSKPVPDNVKCVVCEQVTDKLCEGNLMRCQSYHNEDNHHPPVIDFLRFNQKYTRWEVRGIPLTHWDKFKDSTGGHFLAHRINNGEVKKI